MLEGKVAIVTGGTRGIGYEIVKKFLNNKAKVVLFGSREESVKKAVSSLKEEGYDVFGLYPNLSSLEEVKNAYDEVINKYNNNLQTEVDNTNNVLVNNVMDDIVMPKTRVERLEYV